MGNIFTRRSNGIRLFIMIYLINLKDVWLYRFFGTIKKYSRTSMARTIGTMDICLRYDEFEPVRVNHGVRSAKSDTLGKHFRFSAQFLHNNCMLSVFIRIASMRRF